VRSRQPTAAFGDLWASDLIEVADDPVALGAGGRWAVAIGFEGRTVLARFRTWTAHGPARTRWPGVSGSWRTSLSQEEYGHRVKAVQAHIARGWVYQVNLCRVLSAACDADDLRGLHRRLATMQAPFAGLLALPESDVHIASASPERFLTRHGNRLVSSPIKGTAASPDGFLTKDRAENVMITDLVRNDLGRIARVGSVNVDSLLTVEPYPGLHHLISTVSADIGETDWSTILKATFPPGSVSGAPKTSALDVIRQLEPCAREWYCGTFGWIDVESRRAELAVAIRTFWLEDGEIRFGTGAGITWGSDPLGEWEETQLKAQRLIALASSDSVKG
jgi:para-aminobenzoate synthetase component 1